MKNRQTRLHQEKNCNNQSNRTKEYHRIFPHVPPYVSGHLDMEMLQSFPSAWVLHDSTMRNIDIYSLGQSYCFLPTSLCVFRVENIVKSVLKAKDDLEQDPEVIVIHTGINNIKAYEASQVASTFTAAVKSLHTSFPNSRILISEVLPTKNHHLNIKVRLLNALMAEACETITSTTIIHHSFRATSRSMADDIHPSARGARILAGTLGRAVRRMLWSTPKVHPRSRKRDRFGVSSTTYQHQQLPGSPSFDSWYKADGSLVHFPTF